MFKVLYSTKVGGDEEIEEDENKKSKSKIPDLNNWKVQNFTNEELIFKLNFTNPMYVSTMDENDLFSIEFLLP